jgi:dienelactone hydrolase
MQLEIEPKAALSDRKISFRIFGLPPLAKVKASASMRLPWAEDILFESEAWFTADENGRVDLDRQRPDSGSYSYADSMGLILSFQSKDPDALSKIGENMSVDRNLFIDISVEAGGEKSAVRLERIFMPGDLKRQCVEDPIVADLFYGEERSRKTVVLLGGSGGRLAVQQPFACAMAAHGFNVLSLPYFGEKGLPSELSAVPLEYFEKAFSWLQNNPLTQSREIYLMAMSKGAEAALILAARYPFITRVAAIAPHAYCFQGISFTKYESSWTYQGKQLPYIHMKVRWLLADMLRSFIKNKPFGFTPTFIRGLNEATDAEKNAARIPVENAKADILMLVGRQNNVWNSIDGCEIIMDTLRKSRYPHSYELVVYDDAGESFYAPYIIPVGNATGRLAPRLALFMGGTPQGNQRAQVDAWERMVEFLKRPG